MTNKKLVSAVRNYITRQIGECEQHRDEHGGIGAEGYAAEVGCLRGSMKALNDVIDRKSFVEKMATRGGKRIVTQFGGGSYDTDDYPYVLLNTAKNEVYGRFSTLEKAHQGRLMHAKNHQEDEIGLMLYDEKTKNFVDWRKKELAEFEKEKGEYSD